MKNIFPLLIAFACLNLGCSQPKPAPPELQQLPVITISSGSATTYQYYPASIQGLVNIEIRPQVSGILDQIFVDDGAYVTKGQSLFRIEQAPFREKLNNAEASLQSATGALKTAQLEIDKLTPLVQNKVISDYQLKTANAAKDVALGAVAQAKAGVETAKIDLGYTLIRAPTSGFLGLILRKQGSLVGPSDPSPLIELSDVHNVHVFFALGEYDFLRFKDQYPGTTLAEKIRQLPPVELVMADDSCYSLKGKVDVVNGQFDKNTGAITFRSTFANPGGILREGNTCKVKLGLKFSGDLIVPQSATQELQDQTFVYLLNNTNKVTKLPVIILGTSGADYLVQSGTKGGLKAGDRIVSNGFDHLHEGDVIKPQMKPTNRIANN